MSVKLDERFLPLIFDTISHGIFTIDEDGRITSFNRTAQEITGYTEDEVIGQNCSSVLKANICQTMCPLMQSILTRSRTEDQEVTIVNREGRRIPIAISTAALIDENGRVIGGVEMFRDLSLVQELKKRLYASYGFDDIVSKSPSMKNIIETLPLIANSQSTVLLTGESGTGKELIARAIHNNGPRSQRPFVAINCAAMPDTLLESELFGYKKGAFTDAKKDKPGRFARAEGGTLFLDEIGDLSGAIQAKILRVLQEREYEPLGATGPVKTDVRIICATNKNLSREVQRKRFRQDLFFRINVVPIHLPPLRERREDIPLLVNHFINHFNALEGRRIARCSERVMAAFMAYEFPGNVRELENAIEHAFVVCGGDTIQLDDLPPALASSLEPALPEAVESKPLQQGEAEIIRAALARHNGDRTLTASELGVSRVTLWRKMKKHGIE